VSAHEGFYVLWRSRGLRWGAGFAAILGGSLLAMFALMYWRSSDLLFDTLDRSVVEQLQLLSARPPDMLAFMIESRMNHAPDVHTQVGLFDSNRNFLVGDILAVPPHLVLDGRVRQVMAPGPELAHWRAAGRQLADRRILVVAREADEILEVRQDLVRGAAVGIVPAILLSLIGGALVGIATERRLRRLGDVAERIIDGDLHERLPAHTNGDALDRLCVIVNRMLGRLEEAMAALKGVGDNIAHDLRTPLTSLRARLEAAQREAGEDTKLGQQLSRSLAGVDQALSIITALLRISDIRHASRRSAFAGFDLAAIIHETVENYAPVAEERDVRLDGPRAMPPVRIVGDRQLMVEALVNVVDNAIKFTPPGGLVRVALEQRPRGPVVIVADTGPGIAADMREAVFGRFFRADASRSTPGSGLGLSLVAEVMALHGFSVAVDDNAPGARIELRCWREEPLAGATPPPPSPGAGGGRPG
jgi:signal transduction histidine kinase